MNARKKKPVMLPGEVQKEYFMLGCISMNKNFDHISMIDKSDNNH